MTQNIRRPNRLQCWPYIVDLVRSERRSLWAVGSQEKEKGKRTIVVVGHSRLMVVMIFVVFVRAFDLMVQNKIRNKRKIVP